MCGICVVVSDRGPVSQALVHEMCNRIVHRGPDGEGLHVDGRVGLGMRRLSIIDLPGGNQPIFNEDRSVSIVFNGEIYNYRELRAQLVERGHTFRTQSDTEVVVHLYEECGSRCVERLRGMFAFAIHDRTTGTVFFARDRLGQKPLYWTEQDGILYCASELKSLYAVPAIRRTLDEVALDQYFSLVYIPGPRTIFREIKKLPPGSTLTKQPGKPAVVERYWCLVSRPEPHRTPQEWVSEFRSTFDDAVRSHLVADVPLGVFLSGGVDSSGIVAAMSRAAAKPIKTFSIGFPKAYSAFDEREYARAVARRYGTDHEELEVDPNIQDAIYALGNIFDEPMGDSGAVPNLFVSRMARKRLTVALSGLGGDELCAGYQRYLGMQIAQWYRHVPRFLRRDVIRRVAEGISESREGTRWIDQFKRFVRDAELPWLDRFFAFSSPLERSRRAELYAPVLRERVQLDSALEIFRGYGTEQHAADLLNQLLAIDQQTYMVDDLLVVADRTSMAASLEVRVPFLDHPLVELMASVPEKWKIRGREKKWLLKKAFEPDVPRDVLYRKKAGFSLPVARWLREDLRPLRDELLAPERIRQQGLFDPRAVETLKREHDQYRRSHAPLLWSLLMFQLWAENYLP